MASITIPLLYEKGSEVPEHIPGDHPEKVAEPFLCSWLVDDWQGGSAWPIVGGSPPVAQAGWHHSSREMTDCFSVAGSIVLPCSESCGSLHVLLGFLDGDRPGIHQVKYVRCNGTVKLWPSHSIHRVGRNFPRTVFPLSLHLGENLKDV